MTSVPYIYYISSAERGSPFLAAAAFMRVLRVMLQGATLQRSGVRVIRTDARMGQPKLVVTYNYDITMFPRDFMHPVADRFPWKHLRQPVPTPSHMYIFISFDPVNICFSGVQIFLQIPCNSLNQIHPNSTSKLLMTTLYGEKKQGDISRIAV